MTKRLVLLTFAVALAVMIGGCVLDPDQAPAAASPAATASPQQPQYAQPVSQSGPVRVLVFPFEPAGNPGTYDWVGRGIQQSLLADLSNSSSAKVVFPATQPTQGPVDPIAIAQQSGANLVVIGTFQIVDNQVRVTGQVFDVASSQNIGGLKVTGPIADLFKLEDSLNDQVTHFLPNSPSSAAAPASAQPDQVALTPSSTTYVQQAAPSVTYIYPSGYPYSSYYYPAYSYVGWPVYGFGFSSYYPRGYYHYAPYRPVYVYPSHPIYSPGFGFHGGVAFRGGYAGGRR